MTRTKLATATATALLATIAMAGPAAAATRATMPGMPVANPVALTPDRAITSTGAQVSIDVLANDTGLGTPKSLRLLQRPAHGRARVVDGRVLYTPDAGYTGPDSLQYSAKGTAGSGIATVHIQVGQTLVLQGRAVDSPIANALVSASIDGFHFHATADADGNYVLPVIGLGSPMVTLTAQGVGPQASATFLSVAGEFDRLQAEAGDGILTRDENNQVQVTNVSTAQAYLMQQANGGQPITDDTQLAAAREGVDHGQLLQQAAAIKLVVDGGYALPEGVTDTLALISNPDALAGFMQAVQADNPDAISNAIASIVSDPDLTVPSTAADLVGTYTLVYDLGKPGTISTGFIQGNRVTLGADGSGTFIVQAANSDPSVSWTYDGGRAVIIPTAPVVTTSYPTIAGVGQVRQLATPSRYELSKLFEGQGRDTVALSTTETFSYPDNPGLAGGTRTFVNTHTGIRDDTGILPIAAADLAGTTRAAWVAGTPYANANFTGADMFTFNGGGTGQRGNGTAFNWSVDGLGRLLVAFANGDQASYAKLKEDGRAAEAIAVEWRTSGGARSAGVGMSMTVDGQQFTPDNAQQQWRSGFFVSRSVPVPTDFYMVLDANQIGWQVSVSGSDVFRTPLGWQVNGGVMDATYYRNGSNQPVHYCEVGVSGCYINMVRRWRPVAGDDDRAYMIEEFLRPNGAGVLEVFNQRNNWYDISTAPASVPAEPAIVVKPPRTR